jgi:phosphate-selective porin
MIRHVLTILLAALAATRAASARTQEPELAPQLVGYDDGFFLRSEDGSAELVLEGLFQVVARKNESRRDPESEFVLKRMRPELAGRFDDFYRFRLEPKFTADEVELEEAWVGLEVAGGDELWMFGRMKAPFGLEEVRSRRHIPFPQFSILNQYSPAEQHGVFVNGRRERWEYGLGLYNGGGGEEGDDGKELATRLMLHPFEKRGESHLEHLQLGVAATYGREDRLVAGKSILGAAGTPLMTYAPGARFDGDQLRLGLEAAWYDGPHMAQAEWLWARQHMQGAGGLAQADATGAYLGFQRVLTGEDISFRGVHPARPFRPGERQESGAWVAAARLSYLSADSTLTDHALLLPGTFTSNITSLWLGINWILSDHLILRNSYVHSLYAGEVLVDGHTLSTEGALIVELQLHF